MAGQWKQHRTMDMEIGYDIDAVADGDLVKITGKDTLQLTWKNRN
jgi:hypothetical protein